NGQTELVFFTLTDIPITTIPTIDGGCPLVPPVTGIITCDLSDIAGPGLKRIRIQSIDDGSGEQIVDTITPDHADKVYHQHIIDLSSYNRSANFNIIFAGAMDETLDYWYLDRIRIVGDKAVAIDSFDSGDFNGGSGFSFAWTVSGATITCDQAFIGLNSAQFTNNARIERTVDLSGFSGKKLEFAARVGQALSVGDQFTISIDEGAGWVTVKTLTASDADGYYHSYSIDLSPYNHISTFKIAFEGGMNASSDTVCIDQIQIV
ncbi:MAG: hypothetical protein JKX75_04515, partial [Gammaproteobacteria bacterium]|nr:hypothetical protein [Gammaproteobacteria bacterium]